MDPSSIESLTETLVEKLKLRFIHGLHTRLIEVNETVTGGVFHTQRVIENATNEVKGYVDKELNNLKWEILEIIAILVGVILVLILLSSYWKARKKLRSSSRNRDLLPLSLGLS